MQLTGKTVLITEGSVGMGRAFAVHAASAGARVAIVGKDAGSLYEAATEIEKLGGQVLPIVADGDMERDIYRMYRHIASAWGNLDGLVLAPKVPTLQCLSSLSNSQWAQIIGAHVLRSRACVEMGLPYLRRNGSIILTSLMHLFNPLQIALNPLKACTLMDYTEQMSHKLAPCGIRVNLLYPVDEVLPRRGMTPNKRHADYTLHTIDSHAPLAHLFDSTRQVTAQQLWVSCTLQ